jgi:lipopolysaccharide export system permease protein
MIPGTLDRYILREWGKIFLVTALGFPLIVLLFELADNLDTYLMRGLAPRAIALGHVYGLPDKLFLVFPAAVLFATVFALGSMSRHSELTAAKASGRSFYRMLVPILCVALLAAGVGFAIGEVAPPATRRQLELLEELETRASSSKYNFVYRAEEGWTYAIRLLELERSRMRDVILEREGTGPAYPTLAIQAPTATYDTVLGGWTLAQGRFRIVTGLPDELAFGFDSLRLRDLVETPEGLSIEPKKPQEMRYTELGRYIRALERSGGDGRQLTVERALKIAIPFTCIVIAVFAAPLVMTAPRASGAFGVALSLGTTVIFLLFVQLSRAVGSGGGVPPVVAAWIPNALFGVVGVALLRRAPT